MLLSHRVWHPGPRNSRSRDLLIFLEGIETGTVRYGNRKIWYQKILGTGLKKFGTEKVSEPVSETNGNQKSLRIGSEKVWYQKCKQTKKLHSWSRFLAAMDEPTDRQRCSKNVEN